MRATALLLLALLALTRVATFARAWADGAAALCCPERSCCCPAKAAPFPCHGAQAPQGAALRCHHPVPAPALLASLPGLFAPRVVALVAHAVGRAPALVDSRPRTGFGRIESPPPRPLENA